MSRFQISPSGFYSTHPQCSIRSESGVLIEPLLQVSSIGHPEEGKQLQFQQGFEVVTPNNDTRWSMGISSNQTLQFVSSSGSGIQITPEGGIQVGVTWGAGPMAPPTHAGTTFDPPPVPAAPTEFESIETKTIYAPIGQPLLLGRVITPTDPSSSSSSSSSSTHVIRLMQPLDVNSHTIENAHMVSTQTLSTHTLQFGEGTENLNTPIVCASPLQFAPNQTFSGAQVSDRSIESTKLNLRAVTNPLLADECVTPGRLAPNSVRNHHLSSEGAFDASKWTTGIVSVPVHTPDLQVLHPTLTLHTTPATQNGSGLVWMDDVSASVVASLKLQDASTFAFSCPSSSSSSSSSSTTGLYKLNQSLHTQDTPTFAGMQWAHATTPWNMQVVEHKTPVVTGMPDASWTRVQIRPSSSSSSSSSLPPSVALSGVTLYSDPDWMFGSSSNNVLPSNTVGVQKVVFAPATIQVRGVNLQYNGSGQFYNRSGLEQGWTVSYVVRGYGGTLTTRASGGNTMEAYVALSTHLNPLRKYAHQYSTFVWTASGSFSLSAQASLCVANDAYIEVYVGGQDTGNKTGCVYSVDVTIARIW